MHKEVLEGAEAIALFRGVKKSKLIESARIKLRRLELAYETEKSRNGRIIVWSGIEIDRVLPFVV